MKKREDTGVRMAARITGISGLILVAAAVVEARASASTGREVDTVSTHEDLLKAEPRSGPCGCAPCWGPPAPPACGAWS